jgi:hypothetical protein
MLDLYNKKYNLKTLKENIYAVSLIDILKTQIINADFAVKYLLQEKYQLTKEEMIITPKIILYYQTHISEKELYQKINDYDSDNDSFSF